VTCGVALQTKISVDDARLPVSAKPLVTRQRPVATRDWREGGIETTDETSRISAAIIQATAIPYLGRIGPASVRA
jgi:hypothetical protein